MSKVNKLKTMIRQIVREEVAMAIQEVITELKQPTQQVSQPKPKRKVTEKKTFTKNSILNEVLNETAQDGEWKTLNGSAYDSSKVNDVMTSQYGNMMQGEMNNSDIIAPQASEEVKNLFNRDYRSILKKSQQKRPSNR